jgi:hypothetical protein
MRKACFLGQAALAAVIVTTAGLTNAHAAKSGAKTGVCAEQRTKGQEAVDRVYENHKQGQHVHGTEESLEKWYEKKMRQLDEAEQHCEDMRADEPVTKEAHAPEKSQDPSSKNPLGDLAKKLPEDMRNGPHQEPYEQPPLKAPLPRRPIDGIYKKPFHIPLPRRPIDGIYKKPFYQPLPRRPIDGIYKRPSYVTPRRPN